MKKLFVSIVALAAFVACQSNFDDVTTNTPGFGDGAVPEGLVKVYAEVGIGEETKATYGDDLSALWEENDQIALLQESANYGSTFSVINALDIKRGAGTNSAAFWGDITVPTESPRIYHIAYPVSAVSFNTTMSQEVSGVSYTDVGNEGTVVGEKQIATGYAVCTYNSTLSITVPTSQSGKWEPYMYATTPEAVYADGIRTTNLTTLTGAIAIRAYEADGVTPKKLAKVTISSANSAIAGAFTGTATSVGNTASTSAKSEWYSLDVIGNNNEQKAKAEALQRLTSALQSYAATSTSQTKAMSLAFAGSATTITADVSAIAADADGNYTYHLNVAPFEDATLTIQVVAEDGTALLKSVSGVSLAASHRVGYGFKWESASLTNGSIETWYDSYAGNHSTTLEGSKVYVNNIAVEGVDASAVQSIGALVYDLNGNLVAQNLTDSTLSLSQVTLDVEAGTYNVCSFAKVTVNGEERTLTGEVSQVNVTPIPADASVIESSYSRNGAVSLNNNIYGTTLQYTPALSVSIPSQFISSCQLTYGSTTENVSLASTATKTLALGQYDCYVKTVLGNGYACQSSTYTTHITGIPFNMTVSSNADGWSTSGSVKWNTDGGMKIGGGQWSSGDAYITKTFHIPANLSVKVTANGTVGAIIGQTNTATVTVGATIVCQHSKKGQSQEAFSCSNASATMTPSSNIVKCNSSYNYSYGCVIMKALSITY